MNKLYIVFQDAAAGKMWIEEVDTDTDWSYQKAGGCHANDVFESNNEEDCKKYIESEIKASTRYVVFKTRDMNGEECYFWSEMNCCSGTYQEVGGSYSSDIAEFNTKEEAIKYLKEDC